MWSCVARDHRPRARPPFAAATMDPERSAGWTSPHRCVRRRPPSSPRGPHATSRCLRLSPTMSVADRRTRTRRALRTSGRAPTPRGRSTLLTQRRARTEPRSIATAIRSTSRRRGARLPTGRTMTPTSTFAASTRSRVGFPGSGRTSADCRGATETTRGSAPGRDSSSTKSPTAIAVCWTRASSGASSASSSPPSEDATPTRPGRTETTRCSRSERPHASLGAEEPTPCGDGALEAERSTRSARRIFSNPSASSSYSDQSVRARRRDPRSPRRRLLFSLSSFCSSGLRSRFCAFR